MVAVIRPWKKPPTSLQCAQTSLWCIGARNLEPPKLMQQRAAEHPRIRILRNHVVTEVLDVVEERVTGVRVQHVESERFPCTRKPEPFSWRSGTRQ